MAPFYISLAAWLDFKAAGFPSVVQAARRDEKIVIEQLAGPGTVETAPALPIWQHHDPGRS